MARCERHDCKPHPPSCLRPLRANMPQDALDDLSIVDQRHGAHLVLKLGCHRCHWEMMRSHHDRDGMRGGLSARCSMFSIAELVHAQLLLLRCCRRIVRCFRGPVRDLLLFTLPAETAHPKCGYRKTSHRVAGALHSAGISHFNPSAGIISG